MCYMPERRKVSTRSQNRNVSLLIIIVASCNMYHNVSVFVYHMIIGCIGGYILCMPMLRLTCLLYAHKKTCLPYMANTQSIDTYNNVPK